MMALFSNVLNYCKSGKKKVHHQAAQYTVFSINNAMCTCPIVTSQEEQCQDRQIKLSSSTFICVFGIFVPLKLNVKNATLDKCILTILLLSCFSANMVTSAYCDNTCIASPELFK